MAIKKKVTYSVSYVAGTDTLTTKLNSILSDIAGLILSHNSGLSILDTITAGSARWTGAPLYDTRPNNLYSNDYNNRHYESDVIFIGTNEDNVCLSLGFFDGNFIIAMNMTPKVEAEYVTSWSALGGGSYLPFYAVGKQSRFFKSQAGNPGRYAIPYRIINNAISMSVIYWNSEYSSGYSFINGSGETDGTDLVIFATDEGSGQTGLGAAIWTWGRYNEYFVRNRASITLFSFAENLSSNKPAQLVTASNDQNQAAKTVADQVLTNSYVDIRNWSDVRNNEVYQRYHNYFNIWHTFGSQGPQYGNDGNYVSAMRGMYTVSNYYDAGGSNSGSAPSVSYDYKSSVLSVPYNLPHLNAGQAYIRKMRIPGWNPDCKGEIYLLWSPVITAYQSSDIVEVGSKTYAIITEGAVCWAARIS